LTPGRAAVRQARRRAAADAASHAALELEQLPPGRAAVRQARPRARADARSLG